MKTISLLIFLCLFNWQFVSSQSNQQASSSEKNKPITTPENTNIKNSRKVVSAWKEQNKSQNLSSSHLRKLQSGKRSQYLIVPEGYKGSYLHPDLPGAESVEFRPGKQYDITQWVLTAYYGGTKYLRILLSDSLGIDSLIFTFNLKHFKEPKIRTDCPGNTTGCCDSCLESNSKTFVLDMCSEELCKKVKRPMLFSSGRCVGKNELIIGCNELLSFAIANNNPLKYELEINHNEIAFNTDHGDFDAAIAGLQDKSAIEKNGNRNFLEIETSLKDSSEKKPSEFIKITDNLLDSLASLLTEVRSYLGAKAHESCLNSKELDADSKRFLRRYQAAFNGKEPDKLISEILSAIDGDQKNKVLWDSVSKKALESFEQRRKKFIPDSVAQLKQLISRILGMTTSYALLPIQVNDDNADVIELTVRRKNLITKSSEEYKYDFRVRGGVKIDFSAGPSLSLLRDDKFTTKDIQEIKPSANGDTLVTRRSIIKQTGDQFSYMFGSVMHVYIRSGGYTNVGLHLGAAVNTEQRAYLLGGMSVILGRQQRFCVNLGMAFGNVKRLSDSYNLGDTYDGSGEVPTTERFLSGLTFGVSYNLSKPKTVASE